MLAERLGAALGALRRLRDDTGDTYLVEMARVGFGALLTWEAHLATEQYCAPGYGFFGSYFHQPFLPEALVPSDSVYQAMLAAQWIAGVLVVVGIAARPALLAAAGLLVYTMLSDRLSFHHYRHTMAAFATLLAFAPCDRRWVPGREPRELRAQGLPTAQLRAPKRPTAELRAPKRPTAPLWAQHAMKAQVSVMYLASAGSKLFDADWRGGRMMQGMMTGFTRLLQSDGVSPAVVHALQSPLGASLLAKGAIFTELSLAALLWIPRTRRLALWAGCFFHLAISFMTPVRLFTYEMVIVYLLFATPDVAARVVRFDPRRHQRRANAIESFDWLQRFRLVPDRKAKAFTVVDRGGAELTGARAAACLFGALPVLFPAWPLVAAVAAGMRVRRPMSAPRA